jgi:chromosome partitioning protein
MNKSPFLMAVANQKGGVGKTTTAVNLATALCALKKRVLIIDLDPQGNASTGLGVGAAARKRSSYDLFLSDDFTSPLIQDTKVPRLSIIPSSVNLAGADIELVTMKNREFRLKNALKSREEFDEYDYIIMDCPPSLNLTTLNALVVAHEVLVPLQCEFFALEGLAHLMRTIERVKKAFNKRLKLNGIVLTMYDRRNKLTALVERDVRGFFKDKVYTTIIPRNVRVSEAPSYGLPALVYDMKCPGSQSYIKLAKEMVKKGRLKIDDVKRDIPHANVA